MARAERATPSKDERRAGGLSSLTRPTAASSLRAQSASTPVRTPGRPAASSTPVRHAPVATPSARATPNKTPSARATPTRPPAQPRATPTRAHAARATPTRAPPSARAPPAAATFASQKKAAAAAVPAEAKAEPRSDARSLLEARDELQRLMNLLLQAVLANAKAGAAAKAQAARAEAELFTDWNQLEVLRKELTTARHKLARDTHTLDLRLLLQVQAEQAAQATEWLPAFLAAYAALAKALEHTTHLMPAPNVAFSAPSVLASFADAGAGLRALEAASLTSSNVPDVSSTVGRLAAVLREEETELARLQELLTLHAQLENYERSLRIQAIQAERRQ